MPKFSVLIDLSNLRYLYTGIGQFSLNLGHAFPKVANPSLSYRYLLPRNRSYLFNNTEKHYYTNKVIKNTPHYVRRFVYPKTDVWHCTYQNSNYFPFFKKTPIIYTIHDLNFLEDNPTQSNKLLNKIQQRIQYSTALTTISEYTKQQVLKHLDTKNLPIEVIYCGVELRPYPKAQRPTWLPPKPFFFGLSTLWEKKNFHVLLPLMKYLPDYQLVIAGKKTSPYIEYLKSQLTHEGITSQVILAGEINDEEKYYLYQHCEAFFFPSRLEGFGIPLVEAMSMGKPVFCSTLTSIPEVAGQVAYYWDSFEPQAMLNIIHKGLADFKQNLHKASELKAHAARFSWLKAAQQYQQLYLKVLQKEPS